MWEELSSYESPELARLATAVSGSVIWSRADNTAKKYLAAFRQWKGWAHQHSLQAFPVKVAHLVLHMQSVADSTGSKAAVEEAYNAMAWIHAVGDCHSPTESQFSKTVLQGLQRSLTKPVVKKLPITPQRDQGPWLISG